MKNISSIQKINKVDSPKTPGGISKALLTPCRRVGLSRNWRKTGTSPFVSPLASTDNSSEVKRNQEPKKRKCSSDDEEACDISKRNSADTLESTSCITPRILNCRTPSRNQLARKKSKTLLVKEFDEESDNKPIESSNIATPVSVNIGVNDLPKNVEVTELSTSTSKCKSNIQNSPLKNSNIVIPESNNIDDNGLLNNIEITELSRGESNCKFKIKNSPHKNSNTLTITKDCEEDDEPIIKLKTHVPKSVTTDGDELPKNTVTKLSRNNSKSKSKIQKSSHKPVKDIELNLSPKSISTVTSNVGTVENRCNNIQEVKRSPENLTKECMVVIQKKIFKTDLANKPKVPISQVLFDSDSDDVPLSSLNNKEVVNQKVITNEDDEFQEKKLTVKKCIKLPSSELKHTKTIKDKNKPKNKTQCNVYTQKEIIIKPTETIFDVEDDDFVSDKKTILIKKTYNKVTKPSKAKSTGSITQKDIDELMARIETKKNLLLAKAMTNETAELRNLIKKWQKGCQDALTELLELMKTKMPEQNMSYTEILNILKIPPDLVGYDSDNDCFHTPDDSRIVLSEFNV